MNRNELVTTLDEMVVQALHEGDDPKADRLEFLLKVAKAMASHRPNDFFEFDQDARCHVDDAEELGLQTIAAAIDDIGGSLVEDFETANLLYGVTEFGARWLTTEGERMMDAVRARYASLVHQAIEAELDEMSAIGVIDTSDLERNVKVAEKISAALKWLAD